MLKIQQFLSHAKINMGLQVLNKREDGYHNLHSLFVEIDLADELIFFFAQLSRSPVERLKTKLSGVESISRQK